MGIADRIEGTIENWQEKWKDRLRGWFISWAVGGIVDALEDMLPEQKSAVDSILKRLIDEPLVPDDIKGFLRIATERGNPLIIAAAVVMVPLMIIPMVFSVFAPLGKLLTYKEERLTKSARFDPISVMTAWRRDQEAYEHLFEDLKDQGWSDERIEALKFVTLFYPAPSDLVRWQAREVFEPAMIEKYGLDDELGGIEREPFYKAGMTDEQITNFWRAHWEHASWMQIVEMLHRGLIEESDVRDWFRLVEIPPFWRQLLIDSAYTWPTRVDVRRWWDMRTIDETELRRLYSGMGYRGVNLDNYVLWTKVYVAFPDLMARWSKGWISLDDVRTELTGLGMPADRVEEMIQAKVKSTEPERTTTERDITKTDIYKGVKQGIISREQGIELLMELGYDEDEADYLLTINIPADQEDEVVRERELSKTDIKAGLKQEIITEVEARSKLLELRYSPADVEFLLSIYRAVADPPEEIKLKEASKADIVLGVKKGLITPSEAHGMLLELGYAPEAADFILLVKTEESPFSARSYEEFKDITAKYRRAAGMVEKPVPEELRAAADELVRIKLEVDALERAVKEERRLFTAAGEAPEAATKKLKGLQVALNRARSELQRIQLDYNSKVAAWKHSI